MITQHGTVKARMTAKVAALGVLLLVLLTAIEGGTASREGVFVGYTEKYETVKSKPIPCEDTLEEEICSSYVANDMCKTSTSVDDVCSASVGAA